MLCWITPNHRRRKFLIDVLLDYHYSKVATMVKRPKPYKKKRYKDNRNWPGYNEQLVVRGTFFLDFSFTERWDKELEKMILDGRIVSKQILSKNGALNTYYMRKEFVK